MTILSATAGVLFTTRALTFEAAARFARCLNGNAQYTAVTVRPHPRTAGKHVVSYRPTSTDRVAKLTEAFQGTREERAAAQAHCYEIAEIPGGHEVVNLVSGVVYTVRNGKCDCPDFSYRCDGNCLCKHGVMVRNFEQCQREAHHLSSRAVLKPAVDRAEINRRLAADFGDGSW